MGKTIRESIYRGHLRAHRLADQMTALKIDIEDGRLVPADEVDARIAEAVRAERERLALLVLRMKAEPPGTLDRIAAAIREEDKP